MGRPKRGAPHALLLRSARRLRRRAPRRPRRFSSARPRAVAGSSPPLGGTASHRAFSSRQPSATPVCFSSGGAGMAPHRRSPGRVPPHPARRSPRSRPRAGESGVRDRAAAAEPGSEPLAVPNTSQAEGIMQIGGGIHLNPVAKLSEKARPPHSADAYSKADIVIHAHLLACLFSFFATRSSAQSSPRRQSLVYFCNSSSRSSETIDPCSPCLGPRGKSVQYSERPFR